MRYLEKQNVISELEARLTAARLAFKEADEKLIATRKKETRAAYNALYRPSHILCEVENDPRDAARRASLERQLAADKVWFFAAQLRDAEFGIFPLS